MFTPGAPTTRVLFPVLKEASWPHAPLVVHARLLPRADAPLVTFAEDLPSGYVFLTRQDAGDIAAEVVLPTALVNLERRPFDLMKLSPGLAMSGGADLCAERLLDRRFVATLHEQLGAELWVAVPHRVAIYALSSAASAQEREQFRTMVRFEQQNGPAKGHAPVSPHAFLVRGGRVVDMVPLDAVGKAPAPVPVASAPAPASLAPGVPHPRSLVLVDGAAKELNPSIVVLGSGAVSFARAIYALTGGPPAGAPDGGLEHFVARMPIGGWTTRLHVYAIGATLETIATASDLAAAADVVVLVQAGGARLEPALYALADVATKAARADASKARTLAYVGPPAGLATLIDEGGMRPDLSRHDGDAGAIPLAKEIVKRVLGGLRR
jgi:hypothetical protein